MQRRCALKLLPWQYLFEPFDDSTFPDIFNPIWIAALVMLVVLIVLYVLRTRALHRHRLYLDMWEWIFWSGLITFFLVIVGAIFRFDFVVVLVILVSGLGTMAWARSTRTSTSSPDSATSPARAPPDPRRRSARRRSGDGAASAADGPRRSPGDAHGSPRRGGSGVRGLMEIRRFGVGNRRPDGPPGSVGVEAQVIHGDARGVIAELAFRKGGRI